MFSYSLYKIGFLALTLFGMVSTALTAENRDSLLFSSSICVFGVGLMGLFYSVYQYELEFKHWDHNTDWENYALEILDLKLNQLEINS